MADSASFPEFHSDMYYQALLAMGNSGFNDTPTASPSGPPFPWHAFVPTSAAVLAIMARAVSGKGKVSVTCSCQLPVFVAVCSGLLLGAGIMLALSWVWLYYKPALILACISAFTLACISSGIPKGKLLQQPDPADFELAANAIPYAIYSYCVINTLVRGWSIPGSRVSLDVGNPYLQGMLTVPAEAWVLTKSSTILVKFMDMLVWHASSCTDPALCIICAPSTGSLVRRHGYLSYTAHILHHIPV